MDFKWARLALVFVMAAPSSFGEEETVKISQQPFPDSDIPTHIAEGTVDAPAAEVWAVVSRCADYFKTMPRIAKSLELSREGDEARLWTVKCQVTAALPFPFSNLTGTTLAIHKVEPGVKYTREWSLVSGDYDFNNGSWTLVAIDGGKRTYATYKIRVKPKINLPTSWISRAQQTAAKEVILSIRAAVRKPQPINASHP